MKAIFTRTAEVCLRHDGIVVVKIFGQPPQTITDARNNLEAAVNAREKSRCPLLIDIQASRLLDPQVRKFYASRDLSPHFTGFALLANISGWGRAMGNLYLGLARHEVPMKLFQEEHEALYWLLVLPPPR